MKIFPPDTTALAATNVTTAQALVDAQTRWTTASSGDLAAAANSLVAGIDGFQPAVTWAAQMCDQAGGDIDTNWMLILGLAVGEGATATTVASWMARGSLSTYFRGIAPHWPEAAQASIKAIELTAAGHGASRQMSAWAECITLGVIAIGCAIHGDFLFGAYVLKEAYDPCSQAQGLPWDSPPPDPGAGDGGTGGAGDGGTGGGGDGGSGGGDGGDGGGDGGDGGGGGDGGTGGGRKQQD
jgi:hypothetical protein